MIAESEHTLSSVDAVGDGFIAVYLVDAQPEVRRFAPDGTDLGRGRRCPAGPCSVWTGSREIRSSSSGLSAITSPTESYRVDAATGEVTPLPDLVPARPGSFVPPAVRVERRRATSARRHSGALLPDQPGRRRPLDPATDAALGLRRLQDSAVRRLPTRLVRLARGRWAGRDRQPARRGRVRHRVVRGRPAGAQAERLRRLHRGRRAPECDRGDHARPSSPCTAAATAGCWSGR